MSEEQKISGPGKELARQPRPWDESRVIVLLIGLSLLIEGVLIYYQAGISQAVVAGVTSLAGVTMLLFAWLVPFEEFEDSKPIDEEEIGEEVITALPDQTIQPAQVLEKSTMPVATPAIPLITPVTDQVSAVEPPLEKPAEKAAQPAEVAIPTEEEPQLSWFQRLTVGLTKTRSGFIGKLKRLVLGSTKIDTNLLDELEEALFEADVGVKTTQELLQYLHKKVDEEDITDPARIYALLRDELRGMLTRYSSNPVFNPKGLTVYLVIGVNGVGKTTTIAKLARRFVKDGKKVILAAGDTFRAAAIDQLTIWGDRVGVEVIRGTEGGDPGALVFDAIHAAQKRGADLLIIDTAGRMHVKANLMAELKKVQKIAEKESDGGPHEILLVLDATTGQNAVQQAKLFKEALPITGLVVTKLDGTAKGGVLFAVEEQISAPVKFIGVGEKMDDLMLFNPEQFLEALFADDSEKTKQSDYNVVL
ncbi:MAG TPA: signal recognition particle-docking protein FtsY [Candidatus Rifleibacterium sp.]|nr:signal recognition particle-docking protein FtsY [Candidatus Rifleibacterium sp.]HPT45415.1 signal recognition particle-docking protein FtsY [Candidatus Rifleibacterium sp.]